MDILKMLNVLLRFLLELCMLAAAGYWGFKTGSGWAMKAILGIGLPVLLAVLWGIFVAPKAVYPLHGAARCGCTLCKWKSGFGMGLRNRPFGQSDVADPLERVIYSGCKSMNDSVYWIP
jgi:hypothetical protein